MSIVFEINWYIENATSKPFLEEKVLFLRKMTDEV